MAPRDGSRNKRAKPLKPVGAPKFLLVQHEGMQDSDAEIFGSDDEVSDGDFGNTRIKSNKRVKTRLTDTTGRTNERVSPTRGHTTACIAR